MKTPYLIIEGEKAEFGQPYWTVSLGDLTTSEHIAQNENNISSLCYLNTKEDAMKYQSMAHLLLILAPAVISIEQKHKGNTLKSRDGYAIC